MRDDAPRIVDELDERHTQPTGLTDGSGAVTVRSISDGFSANLHLFRELVGQISSCSLNHPIVVTPVRVLDGLEAAGRGAYGGCLFALRGWFQPQAVLDVCRSTERLSRGVT